LEQKPFPSGTGYKCTDRVNNVPIGQCANMPMKECFK